MIRAVSSSTSTQVANSPSAAAIFRRLPGPNLPAHRLQHVQRRIGVELHRRHRHPRRLEQGKRRSIEPDAARKNDAGRRWERRAHGGRTHRDREIGAIARRDQQRAVDESGQHRLQVARTCEISLDLAVHRRAGAGEHASRRAR